MGGINVIIKWFYPAVNENLPSGTSQRTEVPGLPVAAAIALSSSSV